MSLTEMLDRVPEGWALRWARRTNLGFFIFQAGYLAAWWFSGLRAWAGHHLSYAEAFVLGLAWLPAMAVWLIFQSLAAHHFIRRSREQLARLCELEWELHQQWRRLSAGGAVEPSWPPPVH